MSATIVPKWLSITIISIAIGIAVLSCMGSGDSDSPVASNSATPSADPVAVSCDSSAVTASVSIKLADWLHENMAELIRDQLEMLGRDRSVSSDTVSSDTVNSVAAQLIVEISSSMLVGTRDGIPVCDAEAYVGFRDAGGAEDQTGSGALPVEFLLAKGPNGPQVSFDVGPFPASFIAGGGLAPLSALDVALEQEVDHQRQLQESAKEQTTSRQ
jgi:hypothetical protein